MREKIYLMKLKGSTNMQLPIKCYLTSNSQNKHYKSMFNTPANAVYWSRVENRLELCYLLVSCMKQCILEYENNAVHPIITSDTITLENDNNFYIQIMSNTYDDNKKISSIKSPFTPKETSSKELVFKYVKGELHLIIDLPTCSALLVIFTNIYTQNIKTKTTDILLELADCVHLYTNENKDPNYEKYCNIIYFLFSTELLYTRVDTENESTDTHPKYHIDITTEAHSQVKIGLLNDISINDYIFFSNTDEKCHYITPCYSCSNKEKCIPGKCKKI